MPPRDDISKLITRLQNEEGTECHKVLKPYLHAGRWIPMAIGPFINIDCALYAGAVKINNVEPQPGTDEEDISNFKRLSKICPNLKLVLKDFNGDVNLLKRFICYLSSAASGSRADDTSSCRRATADYVMLTVKPKVMLNIEKKSDRGWNNLHTARLLCPLKFLSEFDDDPDLFMSNVNDGTIKIKASYWPSFLYPRGTIYNREALDEGLFQGEVFIQFLRNIYTGPTSASDGIRRASKPSKGELHGMDHVSGRCVAYTAVQAYFSLSSIEQWSSNPQDGFFNLDEFFTRCVDLFETDPDDEWVIETLDYLTRNLPSLKRDYRRKRKRNNQTISSDESDEDETKLIHAQREARHRAQDIENDTSAGDGMLSGSASVEDSFGSNPGSEPQAAVTRGITGPPSAPSPQHSASGSSLASTSRGKSIESHAFTRRPERQNQPELDLSEEDESDSEPLPKRHSSGTSGKGKERSRK